MTFEEKQILDFLKPMPGVYFTLAEIGKKAGSRKQFQENPTWPRPHLVILAQRGEVKSNAQGQYCYQAAHEEEEEEKHRYKVGGHLQQISAEEAALQMSPPGAKRSGNSGSAPKAAAA